jgi:hypothetical protein
MPATFRAAIRPEFAEIQDTIPDPILYTFNKTPANLARPSRWSIRIQGNVLDRFHKKNQPETPFGGFATIQALNLNPSPIQPFNAHAEMAQRPSRRPFVGQAPGSNPRPGDFFTVLTICPHGKIGRRGEIRALGRPRIPF